MPRVGVKELKARLSHYLRAVKRGEVVVVTEHDRVIAELRSPPAHEAVPQSISEAIAELVSAGEVTRAATEKGKWRWSVTGLGLDPERSLQLLEELRGDAAV